jgi:hypothetical protein
MRTPAILRAIVGALAIGVVLLAGCNGSPAETPRSAQVSTTSAAEPSAAPTSTPPPPPQTSAPAVTVVAPKTLLGRPPATERSIKDLATTAAKGFGAPPGKIMVSGAYGTTKQKNVIVFVAMTGDNPDGGEMLDLMASKVFSNSTFHPVDPGPLGGAARCADASSTGTASTFCMWADAGSFGMIYFLYSAAANADSLLAQARSEIEIPQ